MTAAEKSLIEELYKDVILEHSRHPHHYGEIENPDRTVEGYNPLCGDRIRLFVNLDDARSQIEEIRFTGSGCAICNASASMMTDAVDRHSLDDAVQIFELFRRILTSSATQEIDETDLEELGDLAALSGVRRLPMRVKCAMLAWHALREALTSDDEATTVTTE